MTADEAGTRIERCVTRRMENSSVTLAARWIGQLVVVALLAGTLVVASPVTDVDPFSFVGTTSAQTPAQQPPQGSSDVSHPLTMCMTGTSQAAMSGTLAEGDGPYTFGPNWNGNREVVYGQIYLPSGTTTIGVDVTTGGGSGPSYSGFELDVRFTGLGEPPVPAGWNASDGYIAFGDELSSGHRNWTMNVTPPAAGWYRVQVESAIIFVNTPAQWTLALTGVASLPDCDPGADESLGPNLAEPNLDDAQGEEGDPVNTATGNFHLPVKDLVVTSRGPGLNANRAYNSLDADSDGPFGPGWSWSYGMRVATISANTVGVVQENGSRVFFFGAGPGAWRTSGRVQASLTKNTDGSWAFVRNGRDAFEFDPDGKLTQITDLNGYTVTLDYDLADKLETVTDDASGKSLTIAWDGDRIESITDSTSLTRTVTYGYDGDGQLVLVTDEGGGEWGYGYDSGDDHLLEWATDAKQAGEPSPSRLENSYDSSRRVIEQVDRNGVVTTFDYTTVPGTTIVTDPDGYKIADHHAWGLRSSHTKGYGTSSAVTWEYEYDSGTLGITQVTDPYGHEWLAGYDAVGNRVSTEDPLGRTTSATYNAWNLPDTATDAEGVTTTFGYDGTGNLTSVSTPLDGSTTRTVTYDLDPTHAGDVLSATDARGKVWSFGYDTLGYRNAVTDPLGNTSTAVLNDLGWVMRSMSPRGNASGATPSDFETSFTYDDYGNVLTVDGPEDTSVVRTYDDNRNLTAVTDAKNQTTSYTYDDDDKLTTITRSDSTALANVYTDAGRLWKQIDGAGQQTVFTYDPVGRLASKTDPATGTTGYRYDASGNLTMRQDPGGNCAASPKVHCVTNTFDDANQLIAVDYTDPDTADLTAVTYDNNGRRTSVTNANTITDTWGWDDLGRLTASSVAGRTTSYGFDGTSNLVTSMQGPTGPAVTRTFDDAGRLATVDDGYSRESSFGYDDDSNWTSTTFPGAVNEDTYTVDNAGRMTGASYAQGGTNLATLSFGRDALGLVDGEDLDGLPGTDSVFGYNSLNKLDAVNSDTFSYDEADNLTVLPGAIQNFTNGGQLCWVATAGSGDCDHPPTGATTFDYDERGNRTIETPDNGPATTYAWTQTNLLREVAVPSQSAAEGKFVPVAPARVLDTRAATRTGACPTAPTECVQVPTNGSLTVQVTGQAGLPATGIDAVSLRVTAPLPTGEGTLSVSDADSTPTATAEVAYDATGLSTGTVLTGVSATGAVTVSIDGAATDLVIDVDGYYTTPARGGGTFTPVEATRIIDTTDTATHPACVGTCERLDTTNTLVAQITGQAGLPASGVAAVAVNVTALDPANGGGFIVWPSDDGSGIPTDVATSFTDDPATTKLIVVPVSANGRIAAAIDGLGVSSDIAIDVVGWFSTSFRTEGSTFHPIGDVSLLNTTTNTQSCSILQPDTPLTMSVTDLVDVPDDITAVSLNVTAINGSSDDQLTLYQAGTTAPDTPSVQFAPSAIRSNAVIVPVDSSGDISIVSSQEVGVAITVNGYFTSAAATDTYTYTYDADGLRATKTGPDGTTTYDWDKNGPLPLLIAETTGTDTTRYIYGAGGQAVEQINTDGSVTYLHHDQLGSTRLLTDNTGAETGAATYNPYGTLQASTGTLSSLGYAGQYTDTETGNQYLRARYYDPDTGQFLSQDPLTVFTGEPYGYTGGNPTNHVDPTGLWWSDVKDLLGEGFDNRGPIVTAIAVGTCVLFGFVACAAASTVAFLMRSWATVDRNNGFDGVWDDLAIDFALTYISVGIAGIASEGMAITGVWQKLPTGVLEFVPQGSKASYPVVLEGSFPLRVIGNGILGSFDALQIAIDRLRPTNG